ncbi:hypothetical protein [Verrucosispora sp. TAA-831]|uniref:hypothetical protein n=1 Tax=Verrucosispora sp. TAA-831 TaxID=3422227 RepID=UPI003D6E93FF
MQIPQPLQDAYAATAEVVAAYASLVAAGAGAVGALIAVYTFRKFVKRHEHDEIAANLGVLLFLVVTTEGMWEVVRFKMGVPPLLAVAMFAAYDVVIYSQGAAALRKLRENAAARIGSNLLIIWGLSAAASVTVSFAGGNLATWFFRFFSPLVAAALWTQKLQAHRARTGKRQESNWIWTPDRLLVRWGLKKPGAVDDLSDVFSRRRIAALVNAGMELYVQQQAAKLRGDAPAETSRWPWRRQDPLASALRHLQELTKEADAATVRAAREQLRRVLSIETELFRDDTRPTESERRAMNELLLSARMVTTDLGRQVDQMRDVGWVRMPTSIADQIPDHPPAAWIAQHRTSLDQPTGQTATSEVDQPPATQADQGAGPAQTGSPDQTPSSGTIPAVRPAPAQRATVRVAQVQPVSPAPAGEVPPRVRAMVQALREQYPDQVPGRRTVMPVMGWTNHEDSQTAINLVRAERTKTTQE